MASWEGRENCVGEYVMKAVVGDGCAVAASVGSDMDNRAESANG